MMSVSCLLIAMLMQKVLFSLCGTKIFSEERGECFEVKASAECVFKGVFNPRASFFSFSSSFFPYFFIHDSAYKLLSDAIVQVNS